MSAYVIVEILEVSNLELMQDYVAKARGTVAKYDGHYRSVRAKVEKMEGDWHPNRLVILEFPSLARAHEWYDSPEYHPLIAMRNSAARANLIFVEGN